MLPEAARYDDLVRAFRWRIPDRFNIGTACVDAHGGRIGKAGAAVRGGKRRTRHLHVRRTEAPHQPLRQCARRLRTGAGRSAGGVPAAGARNRHRASGSLQAGLVSVPLFTLFGDEALSFRLANSGAKALVTDLAGLAKLDRIRHEVPDLTHVFVTGPDQGDGRAISFDAAMARASDAFTPSDTGRDDPRDHHLHLGHHRKSQGRSARPPHPARASAVHRIHPPRDAAAG